VNHATPALIVAWSSVIQRYEGLAPLLGAEIEHFQSHDGWHPLLRYADMGCRTLCMLFRRRPAALLVMLPPFPLLLLAVGWAKATHVPIVLDLHSAVFERRTWAWALRPTLWLARGRDLTLVSNEVHLKRLTTFGVRAAILHEVFEAEPRRHQSGDRRYVLMPASWHDDEPIGEVYRAAEKLPGVDFIITGRPRTAPTPPANVTLTGYLLRDEYTTLLANAGVILALTKNDNTMQAAGYQALTWHRPLVTSDYPALREFFRDAATYARPSGDSIAEMVRTVLADRETFAAKMARRHQLLLGDYPRQLSPLLDALRLRETPC
jgi:hypothetical protein